MEQGKRCENQTNSVWINRQAIRGAAGVRVMIESVTAGRVKVQ